MAFSQLMSKKVCIKAFNLGVSRHKAVHVVVDLLEYEASVHEGEAALCEEVS